MELEADRHRAQLFLFLSQSLKLIVFSHREWQCSEQESHTRQELIVVDPRSHESTGTDLNASPLSDMPLSMSCHQIFRMRIGGNVSQQDQSQVNTRHEV
jgi:hypothetical protein